MIGLCLLYTRVSSEKQTDGYSLDSQEDICRDKAFQLGFSKDQIKVFREEGVSATTTNRPELQKMLALCRDKKQITSAVIVYSFSRLNRNALDYLVIRNMLSKHGVRLYSCTEPSGDTPAERMIGTIMASYHQYSNEERGQNVANSLKKRFLEGNITSKPPNGYLMQKVNGKSKAVRNPESFVAIQTMWHRVRDEKLSVRDVARELNKLGIKPTHNRRCKTFTGQTLSKMFMNKFYMGILVSEKHPEWSEVQGTHEPMVTEDTFYQVRQILTGRRPSKKERYAKQREDFPLKGLLRCPECPRKLTAGWSKHHTQPYYSCSVRGTHKIPSLRKDVVEPEWLNLLDHVTMTDDFMQWFGEIVLEKYNARIGMIEQSEDTVYRDIEEIKDTKKKVQLQNARGVISDADCIALVEDLDAQLAIKKGIVSEKKIDKLDLKTTINFIKYYFTHLKICWQGASLEGKLRIGSSIFPQGVVFEKDKFRTPVLGRGYALTHEYSTTPVKMGEPGGSRTPDICDVNATLYQLSYGLILIDIRTSTLCH